MNKMSYWGKPVALLAVVLSGAVSLNVPATAVTSTTANSIPELETTSRQHSDNWQLAQGLVGQCRAAKMRIFVYSQRSTTSRTLRTLEPNEQVILADSGGGGWIAISSPEKGFVQTKDITTCQATNPPATNQSSSLCRIVTYKGPEGGLAIRSRPERGASQVGGVRTGERITLKTSPPPATIDKDGRAWVEVTAPNSGWISNGFPGAKSTNIGACP
jgi:hypothetical protein